MQRCGGRWGEGGGEGGLKKGEVCRDACVEGGGEVTRGEVWALDRWTAPMQKWGGGGRGR